MNKHFLFISLLSFIHHLLLSFAIEIERNLLDISDFTFYYQTYHYSFNSLSTETKIIYNDDLQTNITINFGDTISLIIDNTQSFNILNNHEWDEISLISSIEDDDQSEQEQEQEGEESEEVIHTANRRSLLRHHHHHHGHHHGHHYGHLGGFHGKKFSGVRHGRNWDAAKNYCKLTRRGILATIHNSNDNNKVTREC